MNAQHASDEVTDLIASIEMHRQEIERESGLEASRTYALPRLQELLRTEQEAAQQPDAPRDIAAANIEAINNAIRKVQSLSRGGGGGQRRPQGQGRAQQRSFRGGGGGGGQQRGPGGGPGQGQQRPQGQGQGQGQPRHHRGRRAAARNRGGR